MAALQERQMMVVEEGQVLGEDLVVDLGGRRVLVGCVMAGLDSC
jgi:hypothetical protein